MSFGDRLRRYREAAGLTQAELAERAGLTVSAIGALERGERRHPYPHTLRVLATALDLNGRQRDELFTSVPRHPPCPTPMLELTSSTLPNYLSPPIGREAEVAVALRLLRQPAVRLLTLTGPGGVGKTRLAVQVATDIAAEFPDGVVFVALASLRDPALVLGAIAHAAGVLESIDNSRLANLARALTDQRLLLVLDNFEHVAAAAWQLTGLLRACPSLKAAVTSRVRLRVAGEQEYRVPPLELPSPTHRASIEELATVPAVALFVDRAQAVEPAFILTAANASLVVQLCRRLDGLPLAIELAAARVSSLPLSELVDRLDRSLQVLTGGARDAPTRQHTMRDTIAWSYDLLTPQEQTLFRQLAVFDGGFTLAAAESMTGSDPQGVPSDRARAACDASALDLLTSLVDHSLVRYLPEAPGGPRYLLLATIREYATERLARGDEETAARQRHADYFLGLTETAEADVMHRTDRVQLDRLDAEHHNFVAALEWLAQRDRWLDCLRLAAALSTFWDYRGHLSEGRAWLERALDPDKTGSAPPALRAQASYGLGVLALYQGDYDAAEQHLTAARAAWLNLENRSSAAWALMFLGGVAEYRGDDASARPLYEEARALLVDAHDPVGTTLALNNLADTAYRRGDYAQADALAQEALVVGREAKLPIQTTMALVTVSEAASALGDEAQAVAALRESLAVARDMGYHMGIADVLAGVADVAVAGGDPLRAARLLGAAHAFTRRIGAPRLLHQALYQRALDATVAAVNATEVAAAWAAGPALTFAEAADEARDVLDRWQAPQASRFTPRQLEVLRLLVAGQTDREIADTLFIGTRTVESHVAQIFAKLDVHTRAAAVAAALAAGLVDPPPNPARDES